MLNYTSGENQRINLILRYKFDPIFDTTYHISALCLWAGPDRGHLAPRAQLWQGAPQIFFFAHLKTKGCRRNQNRDFRKSQNRYVLMIFIFEPFESISIF